MLGLGYHGASQEFLIHHLFEAVVNQNGCKPHVSQTPLFSQCAGLARQTCSIWHTATISEIQTESLMVVSIAMGELSFTGHQDWYVEPPPRWDNKQPFNHLSPGITWVSFYHLASTPGEWQTAVLVQKIWGGKLAFLAENYRKNLRFCRKIVGKIGVLSRN